MQSIAKKEFTAEVVREYSYSPESIPLGRYDCTLELIQNTFGEYFVEWDIPDLNETEVIGLEVERNSKEEKNYVVGFDGIMDMPSEVITFLEENGFDCTEIEFPSID